MKSADTTVAVIGGGAAGLLAAGTLLSLGERVTLYEHKDRTGLKLGITGKGRCNLTNNCDRDTFLSSVVKNPRFLYSAVTAFSPSDTMALFEKLGVPLKTERGQRVFPVSDKASDIVYALRRYAKDAELVREHVREIKAEDGQILSVLTDKERQHSRVILATGGASYPVTGSDGSGYAIARALGHTVTDLVPSLVPVTSDDPVCPAMQGLSLRNVALTVKDGGKVIYRDFGEMLFTHFGLSGPMILSASAHLHGHDFKNLVFSIDLKPALDDATLDRRLLSDIREMANRDASNALSALLPQKMILPFLSRCGIPGEKKMHDITREERARMRETLKSFTVAPSGFRPISEAIITSGGVDVREVNPATMESRLIKGLYFAGEILDVDAYTGGFNLQIAFSTAYLAAKNAARK